MLVESAGQLTALSPKGARGIWQLMPDTARRYGLTVNTEYDERLDVPKATHAAARYLRDLHRQFGNWPLAFAAYNAGERLVEKASTTAASKDFALLSKQDAPPQHGSSITSQDPNHLRGAYGPADYDVRHSLNASYVWEIPMKAMLQGHGSAYVVKGWQISGAVFARSASPYTAIDWGESGNLAGNNFAGPIYAVPVGPLGAQGSCGKGAAIPAAPHPCLPPQFLVQPDGLTIPNPNALFLQSGCETGFDTGNLGQLGSSGPCPGVAVAFAKGRTTSGDRTISIRTLRF